MSRDRDRILEQALKHELRAAGTPPAGAPALRSFSEGGCLDAETLGAWADDALDANTAAACEAHVSNCSRCQALVAAMARGTPGTTSTLGTADTHGAEGALKGFPLWKWWLAPIAAGAAAVTLWMVVPENQRIAEAPPQAKQSVDAQPSVTAVVPPAPPAPAAQPAAAAPDAAANAERFAARDSLAAGAREDRAQNVGADEKKEEVARRQERSAIADARITPAAPPTAVAAPAPAGVALEATPAAPAEIGALQKSARAEAAIEIATLDPSLRWRIIGDRIERSGDGGRTWTVRRQQANAGLAAGSAPSNSVAWFVGRAGQVLLTTDSGATFTDVSLAEPLDLASVAATDARNAMIFSVVGRRFRTDDGGRTWRPF